MEIGIVFADRHLWLDDQNGTDLVAIEMQRGGYEAPLPMMTMAVLSRTPGVFCDVGANNGLYSVLACKAHPKVTVAAFEPFPPALRVLRRNLALNLLHDRVTIFEAALSDEDGTASLFIPDPAHGLLETSCSLEEAFKNDAPGKGSITILRRRLDQIADQLQPISLIKADIEGHEMAFLRGAGKVLAQQRPIVFAEMLPAAAGQFPDLTALFDELRYYKFRLRTDLAILTHAIVPDHSAWNYAFVPDEKLTLFQDCCETHGVEMLRPL